ncbi:hypothetical protein B0J13DRAFT_286434 [Dactylonectria estremocensis]|uniref:Zn(2)-C6 fungal-type domain-containing protein n=1 Tax=Dactylonectria estremocensis TaxID=1079267 RepID=A0A9P9F3A6_9HYPO|nr:hypothetical protein B0J13DRAFT_286434 [Dactylonectria estremocensis]
MARRGSSKVKTGCTTCKIRKVKCDETWPQCLRCKKTGRTCDGYRAPPTGSLSWDVLLRPPPSVAPACDVAELRSLAFFHQVVAPVLSGPFDASFWTHLVAQVTHHEPAARHAVLAISSFFEDFSAATCRTSDNPFAIGHYNQAIKRVVTSKTPDVDTVLVVCILFICIEFLRGDEKAAINHARHGVRVLGAAQADSKLAAVFCHVSIFPLFFGGAIADVPLLTDHAPEVTGTFQSIIEAQHSLDAYATRAVRLVRMNEDFQIGIGPHEPPSEFMMNEQRELDVAFKEWGKSFARFQATRSLETNKDPASLALKIRWVVGKIWVRSCLTRGEMIYDGFLPDFENIISMARCALLNTKTPTGLSKKFMFDMGFSPLLHFVVLKCRCLRLRLAALSLMEGLSCSRESLWNAVTMHVIGKRVIEIEHEMELTPETTVALEGGLDSEDAELPSDEQRIRGYFLDEGYEILDSDGVAMRRRCMSLLRLGPGDTIETHREWVTVRT